MPTQTDLLAVVVFVVHVGNVTEVALGMSWSASAPALLWPVGAMPFENSAVKPCAFPPLPAKFSVGMVFAPSFCTATDTASALAVEVLRPVGVNVLWPVVPGTVLTLLTSNGVVALTLRKAAMRALK